MAVKTIFVAFPYDFGQAYRDALEDKFRGSGVELRYADDHLTNAHVMEKIRRIMSDVDVCLFDVTGNNPNVMFELGYALGAREPGFVVINKAAVEGLSADITGWDQLRYADFSDLAEKVYMHVSTSRVPQRDAVVNSADQTMGTRQILHQLHFGIPPSDAPRLCIYAVPIAYKRYFKPRAELGKGYFRAKDLPASVFYGPTKAGHETYFWHNGFDYAFGSGPGPDFVEVYNGRHTGGQGNRETNFRVYLSGAVSYMQRLRSGLAENKPALYVRMFENIAEMAFLAMAHVRERLQFNNQGDLAVGSVILNAPDLRVSEARDFFPYGDAGAPLFAASAEMWIPEQPIHVSSDGLATEAKILAEEMGAEMQTRLS